MTNQVNISLKYLGTFFCLDFWTQDPECVRIVQAYADQNERLHISCEYSTTGLLISYFDENISNVLPHLCTTNIILGKILKEKFRSVDINLPPSFDLTKGDTSFFAQDILKLEVESRHHPILIKLEQRRIHLFGITDLVNQIEERIEHIKTKYTSNVVKLNLESFQVEDTLILYIKTISLFRLNISSIFILMNFKR